MALNWNQIELYLRSRGFRFVRNARHGQLWTNGFGFVCAPTPSSSRKSYHAERNFLAQVARAQRALELKHIVTLEDFREIEKMQEQAEADAECVRLRTELAEGYRRQLVEARNLLKFYMFSTDGGTKASAYIEAHPEDP